MLGRYVDGAGHNLGFTGIAVALLGKGRPLGLIVAAGFERRDLVFQFGVFLLQRANVVHGQLDLPEGELEEGATVTILVPDHDGGFELTPQQQEELRQALAQADRGEGVDGWKLLEELTGD